MRMTEEESYVVDKERCPKCADQGRDNSCDNLAVYSDGHKFCFACEHYVKGNMTNEDYTPPTPKAFTPVPDGECEAIPDRGINEKTARKFGYQTIRRGGEVFHASSVYRNGQMVGQHVRGSGKRFKWVGKPKGCEMFGQHLFHGGKSLTITEGEIDAMTVYQVNGGFPVVSLPNGVQSAVRSIKDNLEWINTFNEVVLMFDMDEPGQKAAKEVAGLLAGGKAKIANLGGHKDANEAYLANDSKAIVNAFFNATSWSPDEILHVSQVTEDKDNPDEVWEYPWDSMTERLLGQKTGELILWSSGTGSGKSTILRQVAHHHLSQGRSLGMIMLEESPMETKEDLLSLQMGKPVRIVRQQRQLNELRAKMGKPPIAAINAEYTPEEYAEAESWLNQQDLHLYNHLGHNAVQNIKTRMEFMAISLGLKVIMLDHITALATGLLTDQNSNERLIIDDLLLFMRSLAERTGVHFDIVSQLKKSDKAFEEGSRITLQDLKGSGNLGTVPNTIISLERNRQDQDPIIANTTLLRCLKGRNMPGASGIAGALYYDKETARLTEVSVHEGDDGVVTGDVNPFGGI